MDEEVVKTFNPGSILPITILLKDKKELDRINGEVSKEKIKNILNSELELLDELEDDI